MDMKIETLVSGAQTLGALAVFKETTPSGGGPPLHRHHSQLEIFHVIQGRYIFSLDDEEIEAGPGTCLMVPAGVAHTFKNISDADSVLHFELSPAGRCEEFFARLTAGDFEESRIADFFAEYGMDLLGPPMA